MLKISSNLPKLNYYNREKKYIELLVVLEIIRKY